MPARGAFENILLIQLGDIPFSVEIGEASMVGYADFSS